MLFFTCGCLYGQVSKNSSTLSLFFFKSRSCRIFVWACLQLARDQNRLILPVSFRLKNMITANGFKQPNHELIYNGKFPNTFSWGATTYAYQVRCFHQLRLSLKHFLNYNNVLHTIRWRVLGMSTEKVKVYGIPSLTLSWEVHTLKMAAMETLHVTATTESKRMWRC